MSLLLSLIKTNANKRVKIILYQNHIIIGFERDAVG